MTRKQQKWKQTLQSGSTDWHYSLQEFSVPTHQNGGIKSTKSRTGGKFPLDTLMPRIGELLPSFAIF